MFVLIILLNVFFLPFIWGDKTLLLSARGAATITPVGAASNAPLLNMGRDPDYGGPAWYFEPLAAVAGRQYAQEHTVPLWNPYSGYGTPLAAAMQPQPFYPLTFLLSLHPTPTAFSLFLIARLFVAGIFTYLFLRLFISHVSALAGAIAYMFTGYFILFLNGFHLSVEVMLPGIFYSFERLHRRFKASSVVLCAAVVFVTITGGAPESIFLVVFFGCMYYLYRCLADIPRPAGILRQLSALTLVNSLGFGLAAFLLIPFGEFVRRSFTTHTDAQMPGASAPFAYRDLLGYLVPLVEGPPGPNILFGGVKGVYGYFGIAATLLALIAIVAWVRDRRMGTSQRSAPLVPFFAIAAAIMILKRFGFAPVQWIGYLPLFRIVVLYKYLEPLIGFSVAVLCGIGFSRVVDKSLKPHHTALAIAVVLLLFLVGYSALLPAAAGLQRNSSMFYESTTAGILVLLVTGIVLFVITGAPSESTGFENKVYGFWGPTLLLMCLTGELLLIFLYPVFYKFNQQPGKDANPFAGAPYIRWLQQKDPTSFRVFARNGFLHPDWSGVFGLYDIRSLDAIYDQRYLRFIRAFFQRTSGEELENRFTGTGLDYSFEDPISQRLLQLSSVRYLISNSSLEGNSLISQFVQEFGNSVPAGEYPLAAANWTINGQSKQVLFQHPPSSPKVVTEHIEPGRSDLEFSIALDPSGYGGGCGDGAEFMVDVKGADGATRRLFDRFINPYGNPADRKWFSEDVDLRAYLGENVNIMLSTGPGPKGDNCRDWAGWGDLRLGSPHFQLAYRNDVQIYENPSRLPRAAVFYRVETRPTDEDVLNRLVDPSFNVFTTSLVASSDLTPDAAGAIGKITGQPVERATPAVIESLQSQRVDITASAERNGMLVLNDMNYPGWRAYVDGKESPIVNADYLFRGVILGPGKHRVSFRYEPSSFRLGAVISALSAVILLLLIRFRSRMGLFGNI